MKQYINRRDFLKAAGVTAAAAALAGCGVTSGSHRHCIQHGCIQHRRCRQVR